MALRLRLSPGLPLSLECSLLATGLIHDETDLRRTHEEPHDERSAIALGPGSHVRYGAAGPLGAARERSSRPRTAAPTHTGTRHSAP